MIDLRGMIIRQRVAALKLAQHLRNVSEACRRAGISRTQFYEYRRRFQARGIEGLRDLPPVHKSHPMTTPRRVMDQVRSLAMANPMWGCGRISKHLKDQGVPLSGPTVQRILIGLGLARRDERLEKIEALAACRDLDESAEARRRD